jgi:predicted RNA-binding Zn ribbon-like protein
MWNGYGLLTDFLSDPQWIRDFLHFWHFRVPAPEADALQDLRHLRKLLRQTVEKTSQGLRLNAKDLAALNSWMKVPVFRRLVENQNGFQLAHTPVHFGWPAALGRIAASLAETLLQEPQERLKLCANTGCLWVYVDRTRGNIRRWCNDATCGNRDRVRRSRASRKSARFK